ncbi:xanthine dehydrogenase family protein molybdopterin-binding subunit [Conexibacter stalactiti]|uniref:Xanthine dehydrogenase family protein molybdopterin-binding subunit n=1 Tax=Conexibacter stalactiti TaxID=1940611 RepID=A0ABU4HTE5_9ACTN|nr:xanthine dehydrogenase family protein molybdopterin-binding subunit [Conexibacter stalactiti]MDW5596592.1 xanthine dehydrogenase family protein molybdopterin-binding subunit [Conexibacter stalactiti]MEC5037234.1 xanthine dehydrogenase family protein molybdopterin-binding subunit [Conexibacter stalactiti]
MSRPLGAARPRREDDRLVRGLARHVADLVRPRQLEAVFVRSPHPAARIGGIDAAAALALPGVAAVLTADDLPHTPLLDSVRIDGLLKTPQPALAGGLVAVAAGGAAAGGAAAGEGLAAGVVRFVGEPVALVLASTRAAAEDAAELVAVDWQPTPFVLEPGAARAPGAPLVHEHVPGNLLFAQAKSYGDPDGAFAAADLVIEQPLIGNRYLAAPLEGRGCLAEPAGDGLTVWASTMGPHLLRRRLAQTTGIAEQLLRVIAPDVGGAFGLKIPAAPEEIAVALAARAVGRPVRWVEGRREQLVAAPHAKDQRIALSLAVSGSGELLGVRATLTGNAGAYSFNSASALIEPYLGAGLLPGPYRIEHVGAEIFSVLTHTSPMSPYRGVGWTQPHTARELALDRAARALGIDPAELRRRNLVTSFPHRSATGMEYDSGSYVESLESAVGLVDASDAPHFAQGEPRSAQDAPASARDAPHFAQAAPRLDPPAPGIRRGVGVTSYVEPAGWGSDGALQSEWSFASHDSVRLQVDPTGGVVAAIGTPSQGQGHATTLAQVVADELGVRVEDVALIADDTNATPVSTAGTRASRVATVIGGALALAARRLRARLLEVAAAVLEAEAAGRGDAPAPGDAGPRGGALSLIDGLVHGGARELTLRELAEAAHFDPALRARLPEPDLLVTQFHDPPATYSNGAIAAVVDVDLGTGGVTVRQLAVVEDCGTVLNPTVVDGQAAGAVVQGLGGALLEDVDYGADGRPRGDSFGSYLLPRITDVPELAIAHHSSPSPLTVNGVKGMGESGAIAAPAAIACAVAAALAADGFTVDRLPLTPARVVEGLTRAAAPANAAAAPASAARAAAAPPPPEPLQ